MLSLTATSIQKPGYLYNKGHKYPSPPTTKSMAVIFQIKDVHVRMHSFFIWLTYSSTKICSLINAKL